MWFKLVRTFEDATVPVVDSSYLQDELDENVAQSRQQTQAQRQARLKLAPKTPKKIQIVSAGYERNSDVIAEVLTRANGICEDCQQPAPFNRRKDGTPYLEVHHRIPLAENGEDTVENAAAFCPNCHRKAHYG
jgi:5-methylcytosine-specific restriction protein A